MNIVKVPTSVLNGMWKEDWKTEKTNFLRGLGRFFSQKKMTLNPMMLGKTLRDVV